MRTEPDMLSVLRGCSAATYYARLDDFKRYAQDAPEAAFGVGWVFLTQSGYLDDDALCLELLETLAAAVGRQMEEQIRQQWGGLADQARLNIIAGAGSQKAMSTELGIALFDDPTTTVQQRHRIVAGFAAGDPNRQVDNIVALARQIGSYPDPDRQAILEEFVRSVERNFS